jgi:hypothetical protein
MKIISVDCGIKTLTIVEIFINTIKINNLYIDYDSDIVITRVI